MKQKGEVLVPLEMWNEIQAGMVAAYHRPSPYMGNPALFGHGWEGVGELINNRELWG